MKCSISTVIMHDLFLLYSYPFLGGKMDDLKNAFEAFMQTEEGVYIYNYYSA